MKYTNKIFSAITFALIFISNMTQAQHVNFGIKGGLNFYNINSDNSSKYDSKAGFHLGLLGHIHIDRAFAVEPEIVYSSQGAKYTIAGEDFKANLGYINVPIMLQYMFDNGFRLEAGPQVGFLINAETKSDLGSIDLKDELETLDLALGFGIGYVHPTSGFGMDLRYNVGLSNINKDNSQKSSNSGFQLGVFYLFKHK